MIETAAPEVRTQLLGELITLEVALRHENGDVATRAEYERRFPTAGPLIDDAFGESVSKAEIAIVPPDIAGDAATAADRRVRFRILRLLRRGGTGDLYVAHDVQFGREVALKEVQSELAVDPEQCRRLEQEAQITGKLDHPGVVPVLVAGRSLERRAVLCDAADSGPQPQGRAGGTFHCLRGPWESNSRRRGWRFGSWSSAWWTWETRSPTRTVEASSIATSSPSNIMLGDFGETLVIDWGLAKLAGEQPAASDPLSPLLKKSIHKVRNDEHATRCPHWERPAT